MTRTNEEWELDSGFINPNLAAKYTPWSRHTITRLCNSGALEFINIGMGHRIIRRVSIISLIKKCIKDGIPVHSKLKTAYEAMKDKSYAYEGNKGDTQHSSTNLHKA
jgi:hypothetical protein